MSDTPIYDQLVSDLYAERTKEAYAASPGMIGCGQWEIPDESLVEPYIRKRRKRPKMGTAVKTVLTVLILLGIASCANPATTVGDTGGPQDVRIQTFDLHSYRNIGPYDGYCVVATHDTAQGAGVAMWCRDHN